MRRLILLRHGQSLWNLENRFTGWTDIDLSEQGLREAREAAGLLKENGIFFDLAFTSVLKRAIRTLWIVMEEMDCMWAPVIRSWRLNERHYGALQGKDKQETAEKYGKEQVQIWRRSYSVRPPALEQDDPGYQALELPYRNLPKGVYPRSESLEDTLGRVLPCWDDQIFPALQCHKTVLVAAHGNSLRALIKHLEGISDEDIAKVNIPTGIPRVYELGKDLTIKTSGYLGDAMKIDAAAEKVSEQV